MKKQLFDIDVVLPGEVVNEQLHIEHKDETFDFQRGGNTYSILNNGDNSWSLVNGALSQESVNVIGQAIEDHLRKQTL